MDELDKSEQYGSLLEEIADDQELTTKQKAWLLHYFSLDPTTKYKIRESCEAAQCSYISCFYWRTVPNKYLPFKKYYNLFTDMLVASAESGLSRQLDNDYWPAQQFALSKLSKKYADRVDITSGDQPITSISIVPIRPEDIKPKDERA